MKKNLLLCFDAFGTIFTPRQAIFEQYGEAARRFGLSGFTDEQVASSFKQAFKDESKKNPNYGRATGLGATAWWTNIINKTFQPLLPPNQAIPKGLAPALIHRFSSSEGYLIFPDAYRYLKKRSEAEQKGEKGDARTVVGVITNSDDRVPDVLSSLGLNVHHLRYGDPAEKCSDVAHTQCQTADIDFVIMSYDVGFEKPHRKIFDAATDMLKNMLSAEGVAKPALDDWTLLYVGDEPEKDAKGALDAGWDAILVDRDAQYGSVAEQRPEISIIKDFDGLDQLRDRYPGI